ncbi:MAG: alpha-galactosidase [Akkermansiaceae bacterium]|nr:alpha-galactosidase [Akkermansiaceae bacterium]
MTTDLYHSISNNGITATLVFSVSSSVGAEAPWREKEGCGWQCVSGGLFCEVSLRRSGNSFIYGLQVSNRGDEPIDIHQLKLGPGEITWDAGLTAPHALYSLHPRVTGVNDYDPDKVIGLPPLAALPENEWHALSERCPELPHMEVVVLTDGWDAPSFVEGPLSQNHAHQRKKIKWSGTNSIRMESVHRFLGIESRSLAPGETLSESGFIQFQPDGNLNNILRDYLRELAGSTGTRGKLNPLIRERFFCTWNNFVYWEANQEELLPSVRRVKEALPAIQWYLLDDGYMPSKGSTSKLDRNAQGERLYALDRELPWFHHCPGISFLFDGGEGVDYDKFPDGLDGFAKKVKDLGMRPGIWLGFETSKFSRVALKHPDWFIDIGHESHLLPDLSVPEVRRQLEQAFKTIFHDWGYEAVKTDFSTHLTDNPEIRYRYSDKSGAEWREWLHKTLRSYLPEDGFLNLGCWLAMGAPWHAAYIDSYRDSMDARDGNWQTVLNNVRWSILPSLCGGAGQPIPDADSVSVFKGMEQAAMQTWVNYARVGGMLVEAGGDVVRWDDEALQWIDQCLGSETSGGRVYFADMGFWSRDGLPCASYRAVGENSHLLGLYNWSDEADFVSPDWTGPIEDCRTFTSLETGEVLTRDGLSRFALPARGSALFLCRPD